MFVSAVSRKLTKTGFCSEAAEGGDFGEGPDPIGREDVWREVPEQRLEAAGGPDLVEILEAAEGTEEKREWCSKITLPLFRLAFARGKNVARSNETRKLPLRA